MQVAGIMLSAEADFFGASGRHNKIAQYPLQS